MSKNDQSPELSVVSTLYNEEGNVAPLATNLITAFREKFDGKRFELVLVLNGSEDRTPEIAAQLATQFPELKLVRLQENQGYGGGVQAGMAAAKGEFVGYIDGDEQISAQDVAEIFAVALKGSYDLVKAVRRARHDGWRRLVVTSIYNGLFRIMFGNVCRDVNAKPKVIARAALQKLELRAKDWFLDAEIMIQAGRLNLTIAEIPVVFRARTSGASNVRVSTMIEFIVNMWRYSNAKR